MLSKHKGHLAIPVCFQDFCIMKTVQLMLYLLVYLEHVSKRILLPLPSIKHTFFQRMHWSVSGIPDAVMKDQQTNQEHRYNSGSQVTSWKLCYAAIAGTNEATSEVLRCDLNIETKLYHFKCLQMYFWKIWFLESKHEQSQMLRHITCGRRAYARPRRVL